MTLHPWSSWIPYKKGAKKFIYAMFRRTQKLSFEENSSITQMDNFENSWMFWEEQFKKITEYITYY